MPTWLQFIVAKLGATGTGVGFLALLTACVTTYGKWLERRNNAPFQPSKLPASPSPTGDPVAFEPDWRKKFAEQYERNRDLEVEVDALRRQLRECHRDNSSIAGDSANMQIQLRKAEARSEALAAEFAAYRSRVESGHVPTASEPPGAPTTPPKRSGIQEIMIERTPIPRLKPR